MRKVSFCTQTRDRQKQMTQLLYNNEHAQQDLVTRWKISGRRSKVILQESASDRRNIAPFTAITRHNEQHRDRCIAIRIKSDSFQTHCGERSGSNTDRLFHYSRRNHIFHDSRRYVKRYFELILLSIV